MMVTAAANLTGYDESKITRASITSPNRGMETRYDRDANHFANRDIVANL